MQAVNQPIGKDVGLLGCSMRSSVYCKCGLLVGCRHSIHTASLLVLKHCSHTQWPHLHRQGRQSICDA